jgi:PAN domain-containing protein
VSESHSHSMRPRSARGMRAGFHRCVMNVGRAAGDVPRCRALTVRPLATVLLLAVLSFAFQAAAQTSFEPNTNRRGSDYRSFNLDRPDPALCQQQCIAESACRAWTYVVPNVQGPQARCWLKNRVPPPTAENCCVSGARFDRLRFSFSGYGNPQRPFPGYVGEFQFGPVSISGSGEIREADGAVLSGGLINHTDNLRDNRYPNHTTTWQVVRSLGVQRAGVRTVVQLQVRVVSSNYPDICPVGTLGVLTLIDDKTRLANGQTSDGIATEMPNPPSIAPDQGAACRSHNHGMNNTTVNWTDPPVGGPPSGGNWAVVNLAVE